MIRPSTMEWYHIVAKTAHTWVIIFIQAVGWTKVNDSIPLSHPNPSHCAIIFCQWGDSHAIGIHSSAPPVMDSSADHWKYSNWLFLHISISRLTCVPQLAHTSTEIRWSLLTTPNLDSRMASSTQNLHTILKNILEINLVCEMGSVLFQACSKMSKCTPEPSPYTASDQVSAKHACCTVENKEKSR